MPARLCLFRFVRRGGTSKAVRSQAEPGNERSPGYERGGAVGLRGGRCISDPASNLTPCQLPFFVHTARMKTPLTPKQDEIRTREARILLLARPMIAGGGFAALSMDAIAKQMRYAKGTIYNHFACKEEILLALAIQSTETRLTLFDAAQRSETRSRDRMAAIGLACEDFRTRFADLFAIENMVRHSAVWDKASDQRRDNLIDCEGRSMGMVARAGHDAIQSGDLKLPRGTHVEDICFGLWSLTYGGMLIDDSSPDLSKIGIRDTFAAIRRNCHAMMDGYGWQPLYDAASYRRLIARVRRALHKAVPTGSIAGDLISADENEHGNTNPTSDAS